VVPLRSIEAHLGDRRYSSYSFLTSALERGEWSASRPGRALPPDKEPPVPTVQEAGWAPEPDWTQRLEGKSSAPVGDRTPAVQSVMRHCTEIPRLAHAVKKWTNSKRWNDFKMRCAAEVWKKTRQKRTYAETNREQDKMSKTGSQNEDDVRPEMIKSKTRKIGSHETSNK
jgi:hypothetical protein